MHRKALIAGVIMPLVFLLIGCTRPLNMEEQVKKHINEWSTYMLQSDAEKVASLYWNDFSTVRIVREPAIDYKESTISREDIKKELQGKFAEMPCRKSTVEITKIVADNFLATVDAVIDLHLEASDGNYYSRKSNVRWVIEKRDDRLYIVYENPFHLLTN